VGLKCLTLSSRREMIALLILPLLFSNFVLKESIPYGTSGPNGRVLLGDFNRNNRTDIIFTGYSGTFSLGMIFEREDSGVYVLRDTVGFYLAVWDVGDFDSDGLYDLVTDGDDFIGVMIFESPDSFSYPIQEVWRDTTGPPLVLPISAHDIDQDGAPEIVKDIVSPSYYLGIYEAAGNNQYELIYTDNPDTSQYDAPSSTHAFGDFDADSKIEFVMGGTGSSSTGAPIWIYECIANDNYEKVYEDYVPTLNIKDCFSSPDADGDGKLEFVVKGFVIPTAQIHAFIFEATGNNTYEIVKTFTLPGGDYYGGYSDVGDVDGDSVPEIALEGRQMIHIIKAAGNDSFYVWETLSGNTSGSSVRVFDIDDNGLSEVIISGNDATRIYEYQVGITEATNTAVQTLSLDIHPNPFVQSLSIKFQNPGEKEVTIKVYDITGRLVKTLHKGITNQGCTLIWHGDDEQGKAVARGVYFVRFETPEQSIAKQVVKLR
jgi:hypothetical protein